MRIALVLTLVSRVAIAADTASVAADKPIMLRLDSGLGRSGDKALELPSGWYLTDLGYARLNSAVEGFQRDNAQLAAENAVLRNSGHQTLRTALICIGAGLLLGAGGALYLVRR